MNVTPVAFTSKCILSRTNKQKNSAVQTPQTVQTARSPMREGINTAAAWFGFGVGLDFISRKWGHFFKSPLKNSLLVNSVIGGAAGAATVAKINWQKKHS